MHHRGTICDMSGDRVARKVRAWSNTTMHFDGCFEGAPVLLGYL